MASYQNLRFFEFSLIDGEKQLFALKESKLSTDQLAKISSL